MSQPAPADENRRRLTPDESAGLLARPLAGVFSTLHPAGWIHSVPVHFLYADGEIRFLAEADAVKSRNAARTGQATLCVETTDGTVRSFVSVSGPVTVRRPPPVADLVALDEKYGRSDFSSGWSEDELAAAVILVLRPDRWIAWADWD
ncbi:pyridoxamine 5'-phosphate oxidase family protein [Paractinoplanes globisporus]|uniref:Pyridoxamine 5'-phosphate oxidase family protein n=1 Tax=Paractinoplanes globisporus TaxID=113565 RepID=A0ABW6WFL6_9ACTN|nr:pyridoxamine 5'-phosphate oxidase family protein [Actinoplanes globisporus]